MHGITVDPTDPNTVYVAIRHPGGPSGRNSAFRSRDDGRSWQPIVDALQRDREGVDPFCFAVNPTHPDVLYMGTYWDSGFYRSDNRGDTWSARNALDDDAHIIALLVDPRTSDKPAATVLYAATSAGVYRSSDGGDTWLRLLSGEVTSLTAHFEMDGSSSLYAGVSRRGVFQAIQETADGPLSAWTDLNLEGIGLPAAVELTPGIFNFGNVLVELSTQNPRRLYAWFLTDGNGASAFLYTSGDARKLWSRVTPTIGLPDPGQGGYDFTFGLAPSSPGDFEHDVLIFGNDWLARSTNGGRDWIYDVNAFHADHHALAFFPSKPKPGDVAVTYIGCDGGLAKSEDFADPTIDIHQAQTYWNEGDTVGERSGWQNLNHGLQTSAVLRYSSPAGVPALSYIGCHDTGVAAGEGSLGWRGLRDADADGIAAAAQSDGVVVWVALGGATNLVFTALDTGEGALDWKECTLGGATLEGTHCKLVEVDGRCVTGRFVTDPGTGSRRHMVARLDRAGNAFRISQDTLSEVGIVAANPDVPDLLYCATVDQHVWMTDEGSTASAATVWREVVKDKPPGLNIAAIAVRDADNVFVLLTQPVGWGTGPSSLRTAVFEIGSGSWVPLSCAGLADSAEVGNLIADPVRSDLLYASQDSKVYRLQRSAKTWKADTISEGLPGQSIIDLWIGNIGTKAEPKVLLRAAITIRGIWECDVTTDAPDHDNALYIRDNLLDLGWLTSSPDGVPNPFKPSTLVHHDQCVDIKVEVPQLPLSGAGVAFYESEPEGTLPLSHVLFDQLADRSESLTTGSETLVHVQAHNRGKRAAEDVSVWAIACRATGSPPPLSASSSAGDAFPFWDQFKPDGSIAPSLPTDSPWRSLGQPRVLPRIDAANPGVASWKWAVPFSSTPDRLCLAAFLHSKESPIDASAGMNIDVVTPINRQVGQKRFGPVATVPHTKIPWWAWLLYAMGIFDREGWRGHGPIPAFDVARRVSRWVFISVAAIGVVSKSLSWIRRTRGLRQ